jgi:hypothetical protein
VKLRLCSPYVNLNKELYKTTRHVPSIGFHSVLVAAHPWCLCPSTPSPPVRAPTSALGLKDWRPHLPAAIRRPLKSPSHCSSARVTGLSARSSRLLVLSADLAACIISILTTCTMISSLTCMECAKLFALETTLKKHL